MTPLTRKLNAGAVAMLSLAFLTPVAQSQTSNPALTVELVQPQSSEWPETIPASGWLKPWREAIVASEIGGLRITDILVDIGSVVTKGQPLAHLSQDEVLAELHKQEAAVESATATLAKAEANAERVTKLTGSGALSQEKTLEYTIAAQTAAADLKSAKATLDSQRIKVEQTTVRAVDNGLITSRTAQLGAVVSSGSELFRLVQEQRVEWQAEVPARDVPRITIGLPASVEGPSGRRFAGKVRLVAPTVSEDTGRAIVYVELPSYPRPPLGVFVKGQIELSGSPALSVPESSLVFKDGISYLFFVGDDRRVSRVRVETGRRNAGQVEIVAGIAPSAKVVKAGGALLMDGDLVTVKDTVQ
jgi:RND family efflux transporter MFP subunit